MNISQSCFNDFHAPQFEYLVFDFERNIDYWAVYFWCQRNYTLCYYFVGVYLMAVFAGKYYMKSRPPFQLRGPLIAWNLTLALVNIVIAVRMLSMTIPLLNEIGFYGTICAPPSVQERYVSSYCGPLFMVLKVVELGDTGFIVLRKSRLIFLHWYHHVSVLMFAWLGSAYLSAIIRHFIITNLLMHVIEYSFYALKALQVKLPRRLNIAVTSMQLLEMLLGIYITYTAYRLTRSDPECCVFDQTMFIAAGIYISYFVLFTNYFIKSYITNKGVLFDEKGAFKKDS